MCFIVMIMILEYGVANQSLRLMHDVILTSKFIYGCKFSESPNCNYCDEFDDLTIFLYAGGFQGCFS